MLDHEIAEFGRRMGMPAFALSQGGLAALDVEGLGRLHLELNTDTDELLVYVALPIPPHDTAAPRRVLDLCDYRHGYPMPLSGGVYKDQIVLLTRMPAGMASAADIENAVRFLADVMEKAAS